MIANKEVNATVKFFNGKKNYGFFTIEGRPDAFFNYSLLTQHGFSPVDLLSSASALIDVEVTERGLEVSKIHRIGDRRAKSEYKRTIVDRANGKVVVKVQHLTLLEAARYEVRVGSDEGEILAECGKLSDARVQIGREVALKKRSVRGMRSRLAA